MAKYVEVVPPPAEVDLVFYDPTVGHTAVAPLGFVHHEDPSIVGQAHVGLTYELTYVRIGDAIITYPDGTVFVKKPEDVSAFYEPKRKQKRKPDAELPALPEKFEEADIDELLAGAPGDEK